MKDPKSNGQDANNNQVTDKMVMEQHQMGMVMHNGGNGGNGQTSNGQVRW